jgi:hypothetical protein
VSLKTDAIWRMSKYLSCMCSPDIFDSLALNADVHLLREQRTKRISRTGAKSYPSSSHLPTAFSVIHFTLARRKMEQISNMKLPTQ